MESVDKEIPKTHGDKITIPGLTADNLCGLC